MFLARLNYTKEKNIFNAAMLPFYFLHLTHPLFAHN